MRHFPFVFVVGLAGVVILVSLGVWQVQRLAWKERILAEIDSRIDKDPAGLPETLDHDNHRYLPVEEHGTILDREIHVLVSVKRVGPGYRIISPFRTREGRLVLLDRGFVPDTAKDGIRASGVAQVLGNLHWPRETDGFTPAPDLANNIWFARDVPAMAEALQTEPVLIVAKSQTDSAVTPIPVDTSGIPNDHLQYAITWFSLAMIWATMSGSFLWRTCARHNRAQDKG